AHQPDVRFATIPIGSGEPFQVTATHASTGATLSSVTARTAFNLTVTAGDANGNTDTNYARPAHLTNTDRPASPPGDHTFTTGAGGDDGVYTFSITLKTAGTQTVTATDKADGSITGSTSLTVNPGAAAGLVFGQQPTNTLVGATITPAVTVKVLD